MCLSEDGKTTRVACTITIYSRTVMYSSENKHCVTEAVETVLPSYGFPVGSIDRVFASKGSDQHQQRRPGQMKVGDKAVNYAEAVSG